LAVSALGYFSSAALPNKAALCHLLLARLHWRSDHLPSALRECTRALRQLKKAESPALSCQIFTLMGEIEERCGRPQPAYAAYLRAKKLLEQLRSGIRGEELKISFMRDRSEVYEGLVSLCFSGGKEQAREALGYIEQAKSRSLLDLLMCDAGPALTAPEGKGKVARRIRELREELNWYHHKAELEQFHSDQNSTAKLQRLRDEASGRERELLRLLREHPTEIGEREVLRAGASLPIEQIQSELHPSATILEYFQVRDRCVAVLMSRDHLELVPLGNVERIANLIRQLRFQMAKLRLGPEYVRTFEHVLLEATENHLWELHQELIAPLRSQLRTSHLIVVPHGCLHSLPFHSLFDGQDYLVDNFTVSYSPSASIYFLCNKRSEVLQESNVVMGVPDPSIPVVEEEVASVAKILSRAELAVGPGATTEFLRKHAPQCGVVHIATHGSFREDQPMFSGIRLADGYLSLYDMYQLKLSANLVTLSGCSTGLNLVSAGDEVLGLMRGLIYAGARSCLLTLWDVQDSSTAEFMRFFYESFTAGSNKAKAVRDASLKLRRSYRHPYYWAPFVLVGKVFGDP
jgi:CHAT domain-containing protein